MKCCIQCGSDKLKKSVEDLDFNDVARVEGNVFRCSDCGEEYRGFLRVEELSRHVAHAIALQKESLSSRQLSFLRKYLGYSSKDFAAFLGVSPETVSRWENRGRATGMQLATEKLIRLLALTRKSVSRYGLDDVATSQGRAKKFRLREVEGHWQVAE